MIYEAEQKYQNLHQLFPGPGIVYMVVVFNIQPGATSAPPGKIMATDPPIIRKPDDIESYRGIHIDDRQLGNRSI
jgi:hypothetical protein